MLTKEQREYLSSIYYDPANTASYSGVERVWRAIRREARVTKKQLQEWLREQDAYTEYFPVRRKFKRPRTISPRINYVWGSDVGFMLPYADQNDDYAYLVVFIDLFSRFAYVEPLKTVRGAEMLETMKEVFAKDSPRSLYTDSGSEYKNVQVQRYLKSQNIKHYTSRSEKKVAHAERLIKQLKRKLLQYMNEKNTGRWIDVLDDVVHAYNNSYHRVIKMTPTQAKSTDQFTLWNNQYFRPPKEESEPKRPKQAKTGYSLELGDRVKLSVLQRPFEREYDQKYTTEVFTVTDRRMQGGIPSYSVKDEQNESIEGWFYKPELLKVAVPAADKTYKIEKVLKRRTKRDGTKELFVKFKGYPSKYNSWVSDIDYL